MLPTDYCQNRKQTWFIPGKSPIRHDTIYREVAINPRNGLRTCHIDAETEFSIYEFWPSDMLRLFKQAGIKRREAPAFEAGCQTTAGTYLSPQIGSPSAATRYVINHQTARSTQIPLTAVTDGDVKTLYWFVNNQFLGSSQRDKALIWQAKAGQYMLRVVDDHGQAAIRQVNILIE